MRIAIPHAWCEDDSFSVGIVGTWRMQGRFLMLWSFGCQRNADCLEVALVTAVMTDQIEGG
jgi:hypothetical protein